MSIEKHLKELTKILAVASPWGVTLKVKEDEDKGTSIYSSSALLNCLQPACIVEKEQETLPSTLSPSLKTTGVGLPLFSLSLFIPDL